MLILLYFSFHALHHFILYLASRPEFNNFYYGDALFLNKAVVARLVRALRPLADPALPFSLTPDYESRTA